MKLIVEVQTNFNGVMIMPTCGTIDDDLYELLEPTWEGLSLITYDWDGEGTWKQEQELIKAAQENVSKVLPDAEVVRVTYDGIST